MEITANKGWWYIERYLKARSSPFAPSLKHKIQGNEAA